MLRGLTIALLAALTPTKASGAKRAPASPIVAAAQSEGRLVRRSVTCEEGSAVVPAIHLAPAITTTLAFPRSLREGGFTLLDRTGQFLPPQISGKSLFLSPKAALRGSVTSLLVTIDDGTEWPFQLVAPGADGKVDLHIDVHLAEAGSAGNIVAGQLRTQLEECQSTAGSAGLRKMAELILAQDLASGPAFVVERRDMVRAKKENRLLVRAQHVYRLFDHSYLVLSVENRDPSRTWVLDKVQLRLVAAGADLPVAAFSTENAALPPAETEKVVIIFATPPKRVSSDIEVILTEKGGNRHIHLEGVPL